MYPELCHIPAPSLFTTGLLLLIAAMGVGLWLLARHRAGHLTKDDQQTGVAMLVVFAILLFALHWLGAINSHSGLPGSFNGIRVNSYGAMLMLGFLAGTYTATRLGRRRSIIAERFIDLGLIALIGALIGARGMYLLLPGNGGQGFLDFQSAITRGLGGLSFYGGLLGGAITGSAYIFFTRLSYWRAVDSVAPGIAIGYAITRIGCFLNGCCYGKEAPAGLSWPWALNFLHSPDGPIFHRYPTQIFASLMGFAMFGLLLYFSRKQSLGRAGRLFMLFLMFESVERFVMEIFRQPDPNMSGFITPAQWVCMLLMLIGIAGFFLLPRTAAVSEPVAGKQALT